MPIENKIIRDFIYMDVDRLNSLYSQAFGGVVPQIINSRSNQGTNTLEPNRTLEESPQELLTKRLVTEARHETKNVILYDYLYTKFEDGVAGSVLEPKNLTRANYNSLLADAFLVKVQGPAEIEDYQRLTYSAERFFEIVGDIALISQSGAAKTLISLMGSQIEELEQQARCSTGGNRSRTNSQIADIKRELKEWQDPEMLRRKLIAQMGVEVDPTFMESITKLFRHFNPDNLEITILPSEGAEDVVFRGILDKRLLRILPEYLRVLYQGSVNKKWTMVGEITHFPHTNEIHEDIVPVAKTASTDESSGDDIPALKDAMRTIIQSLDEMEGKFFESKKRVELRIRPLAIYQEVSMKVIV